MFVSWFASDAQLLLLNVILASLVTSLAGLGAAVMAWRLSLSVRHGLLCLAVVSMLASPLAIWVGSRQGLGVLSLSWQGAASQPAEAKDGLPAGPDTDPAGGFSGGASPPSGRTGPGLPASAGIPGSDPRPRVAELPGQAWASPGAVAGGADGRPGTWGLAIWIAGSICGAGSAWRLLRLFQGWSVVRRLRRSLYPPATRRLAEAARRVAPPGRAASGLVFP